MTSMSVAWHKTVILVALTQAQVWRLAVMRLQVVVSALLPVPAKAMPIATQ